MPELYKCPNCEKLRPDDGRKCPHCGADFRGGFHGGKHAVQPRELNAALKNFRCEHGVLRDRPCPKCPWQDCENYETPILMHLKELLIKAGVLGSAQAWEGAKLLRAQIDANEH